MQFRGKTKTITIAAMVAVLMFGFGFALVPLYDVFCKVTGLNGKTNTVAAEESAVVDMNRTITVQFMTSVNGKLPWIFRGPPGYELKVHPGQSYRVDFYAENKGNRTIVAQAVPSVSPNYAASYLLKTECFCFNQQELKPGQSISMPVIFHIDPALPKNVHTLTLSYTMFDTANINTRDSVAQGRIAA